MLLVGSVLVLVLVAAWLMDVQRRLQWKASAGGRYPAPVREGLALIDLAAEGLFTGREISDGALAECGAAFSEFHRYLNQRNQTENNNRYALVDRAAFYLYAIKLTALQHPDHNAWPLMASLRSGFIKPLRREIRASQDAWTALAFITPALLARDVPLAERLYRKLSPRVDASVRRSRRARPSTPAPCVRSDRALASAARRVTQLPALLYCDEGLVPRQPLDQAG